MKTLTILLSIFAAMLVSNILLASNADSTRVEKKIVKTIMITDNGKVIVDSTYTNEDGKVTVHVDSIKKKMMLHDSEGMLCPPPPPPPPVPGCLSHQMGIIDLNDPSIISYEKKIQKNGTEKITIIRKIQ